MLKKKIQISDDDKKIIYHAGKYLLLNEGGTWMKKDSLFDVTMGAEVYDGAVVFKNKSGTQLERIKKSLQKTFKDFGLEIVAEFNLRIVNYLDMTLSLNDGSFSPYHEPDDIIQYINKEFNNPPNIIKHLPASIEKQLTNNSSDEKIFKEVAIYYEDQLNKASYTNKLVYYVPSASNQENKSKNHQRNIIWFKPSHSKSVTTRIGQSF